MRAAILLVLCLVACSQAKRFRRQVFADCLNKPGAYCDYICKSGYTDDPTLRCGVITNRRCCVPESSLPSSITTITPPLNECGVGKYGTETGKEPVYRIVGGQDAYPNEFPWLISLQIDSEHICGGSIIARNWVLTAARCFDGLNTNSPVTISKIKVVAGEHRLLNSDTTEVYAKLEKVILHPDFNVITIDSDLALVKIKELDFNSNIREICLPSSSLGSIERIPVYVAGWGTKSANSPVIPNTLQKTQLITISNDECNKKLANHDQSVDAKMLCANGDARDTCQGDHGSPLIMRQKDGQSFVQVGIASWGVDCAAGDPFAYTRVSKFVDWITHTMAVNS